MKIQSVGNCDCQRKKDVNFSAVLMKRNAFEFIERVFPKAFTSVEDGTWNLSSHQKSKFADLFLTPQEANEARIIDCGSESLPPEKRIGIFAHFSNLAEKAKAAKTYTVERLKVAIESETLYKDENFSNLPIKPYSMLKAELKEHFSLGTKALALGRTLLALWNGT